MVWEVNKIGNTDEHSPDWPAKLAELKRDMGPEMAKRIELGEKRKARKANAAYQAQPEPTRKGESIISICLTRPY